MNFNATDLLHIFLKDWGNAFVIYKISKNLNLEKDGLGYDQKRECSDNTGENIFNKIEKSSKTGQEKKILITTFPSF